MTLKLKSTTTDEEVRRIAELGLELACALDEVEGACADCGRWIATGPAFQGHADDCRVEAVLAAAGYGHAIDAGEEG